MAQDSLIPLSERTKEEQRRIQQMGGRASGKARRRIKDLKEAILAALAMEIPNKSGVTMTGAEGIARAVLKKALNGDPKSVQQILDLLYGRRQEVDVKGNVVTSLPDLHIEFLPGKESANDGAETE